MWDKGRCRLWVMFGDAVYSVSVSERRCLLLDVVAGELEGSWGLERAPSGNHMFGDFKVLTRHVYDFVTEVGKQHGT